MRYCRSSASPTRCGGRPLPILTLGSRKWIGRSWACTSVMCSSDTLPNGGTSYSSAAACASLDFPLRVAPPARATARTRRNARRCKLLVDRRGRVEQQADEVLDLLRRQRAGGAKARHLRAEVVSLGVIDLAVGIALDLGIGAA